MCKDDASQKGTNVSASENPATSGKYALLEQYRGKNIGDIFRVDLRSVGGVEVIRWQNMHDELRAVLKRMGIDPETTRFSVEFVKPDKPLAAGYYQLMGVKPMPVPEAPAIRSVRCGLSIIQEEDKIKETTLIKFILEYSMSQWRTNGVDLGKALVRPNGGEHEAAFHLTQKNGVLIIATSWIDIPDKKIIAS